MTRIKTIKVMTMTEKKERKNNNIVIKYKKRVCIYNIECVCRINKLSVKKTCDYLA